MAEEAKRKFEVLTGGRLKEASAARNHWQIEVSANTHPEDLLEPPFWAHIAARLRVRDRVEVWAEDASWFAEVLILDSARTWAKAKFIVQPTRLDRSVAESAKLAGNALALYDIRHRGDKGQWSVVRKSDKALVHEGEATREGAEAWLSKNIASLKAAA